MVEKARRRIELYLRRNDTFLAAATRRISPKQGSEYLQSRFKRTFDMSIAVPMWVVSLPAQGIIRLLIKLEDGGETTYIDQDRFIVNHDRSVTSLSLKKFRTMKLDADTMEVSESIRGTDKDPRLSRVGRIIRRINFDELPQLRQVICGELSLSGIRAARRRETFHVGNMVSHPEFAQWEEAYMQGKPAVFNPQAAIYGKYRKGGDYGQLRLRSDNLYAKRASFGLDAYFIMRFAFGIKKKRFPIDKDFPKLQIQQKASA